MTTYYNEIPILEMRVAASALIIMGKVGKVISTHVDYYEHQPFVRTTFEVSVKEVLKGKLKQKVVHVEVMGGNSQDIVTQLRVPMYENDSLVFMLVPQYGTDAFVPYFSSVFPMKPEGEISLGPQAAEILSGRKSELSGESISLDSLRMLIKQDADEREAAPEIEMAEEKLPPVLEMPQQFDGGGASATPQKEP